MDGEFSDLSPNGTEFLSLAFIKANGEELYIELDSEREPSEWVKENVLPFLTGETISKKEAVDKISSFLGGNKFHLIADVNQFDWMGLCGLFGIWNVPFHYIPIDFASVLWTMGINPDIDREQLCLELNINNLHFKKHNALDDTRRLKALYEKIV